ncbi:aspartate carbamoyltransferase regulatory subunit [Dysgonomonas sp. PH5-45]|nr:aspartate carbamoyltransferase regulatory subunit [Dysgonomonas sp. PH5-45]MDH6388834.1 aspartate carbamoyltransferase regulatory subunit [Dysgonomonas sp. PH5-37]
MPQQRKELQVAALCNGTVIDHIPSDQVYSVADLIRLERLDNPITIGCNLESRKMGTKGIIKITDKFFEEEEIDKIALVAPNVVLNIIRDYQVVEKRRVTLPKVIKGIVKCNNPKCITNNEPMKTMFYVLNPDNIILNCHYCDIKIEQKDIILK